MTICDDHNALAIAWCHYTDSTLPRTDILASLPLRDVINSRLLNKTTFLDLVLTSILEMLSHTSVEDV